MRSEPKRLRRSGGAAALMMVVVTMAGCGGGARSPACTGYDALVDALRAIEAARISDASHDADGVDRAMDDVARSVRLARGRLAGADSDPNTGRAARAMLEAANYLDFMVGDFHATGNVDFSLTQFASRELNRAASGAGGTPLNC